MKSREVEIVRYPQIKGLSIFLDTVSYRTPHVHEEFELIWILDGQMMIGGIRPQLEAGAGDLVLFDPGRIHEFLAEEPCT
ncbi:MAG: AraC family ligand binding domain-containing protein, partial [Lachnospiraceae bacterium]|nr:AraC family ligand binding domain-containing protein [Lachnospiraceae bacterium]